MTTSGQLGLTSAFAANWSRAMNPPSAGKKRLAIVGATGMVGGYALRYALEHPAIGCATSIGRRELGISHLKLHEVVHQDFGNCSALTQVLSDQDAAVFCMGTYTGTVPDAQLRAITVTRPTEGSSRALPRAYPPTIPVAPTISRRFLPALGGFIARLQSLQSAHQAQLAARCHDSARSSSQST